MKKNHKMLYMILAVLLVSFLFFGSREKNVVEGFFPGLGGDGEMTVTKSDKVSCDEYEFNIDSPVIKKMTAMMYSDLPGGAVEGKKGPYPQGPENCVKFKELKTNVKDLLDELNKIDDH